MDGVKWLLPVDTPLIGVLILGPQKSGKSRAIIRLCQEILRVNPSITITIIDVKDGFRDYARLLSAVRVDLGEKAFDLKPPANIDRRIFVLEFVPPLADTAGLIYGVEVLNEAVLIALNQRQRYVEATGQDTELCLKDMYVALSLVTNASSGRRMGYREAAQTALRRIMGERDLFACRGGISMDQLFSRNTIINARSLSDDMQCRALALFLLYWKYQQCRYKPETNKLEHLIIFDDASRFVGTAGDQFGAASRTSALGSYLALLRATGTGTAWATQLPAFVDPSVLALSRTMLAVGPTSGSQHLKVIADFMSLDKDQTKAVARLSTREAVGFAPGTAFKECAHGWVPWVDDPPASTVGAHNMTADCFDIQPWHNLADMPAPAISLTCAETRHKSPTTQIPASVQQPVHPALEGISPNAQRILYDCVCYPFSAVGVRIKRLGMGCSAFEQAKIEACEKGFLIESAAGQTLYLIPPEKTYHVFGVPNPYKRAASTEHAFYVSLGGFLLQKDVRYRSVRTEVPVGKSGAASDIVTVAHDGTRQAWEVTLNTSHILANANKYENKAFAKIVFLCRDYKLKEAVKACCREGGLNPDLLAKLDYMQFSALLRRQRKLSLY
jgi:hypothetical protein